ncbi:MAG: AlpA family transcriptional regulator [Defluviicoccus sp.]|nr:AlpA family transcriptional regulator [Defluviicoccus sp.]
MPDADRLLRREEVEEQTGLSRSAIYRLMRAGEFPTPIRIGPRAVRWPKAELDEFLAQCPRATGEAA